MVLPASPFCRLSDFPRLASYSRFVELIPGSLISMIAYLNTRKEEVTGISYVDSTSLSVCKNVRPQYIEVNELLFGILGVEIAAIHHY